MILTTHSEHMLNDPGIGPDEVLYVEPGAEGSVIAQASENEAVRSMMLNAGLTASEAVLPRTAAAQLNLFDDVKP